VGAIPFILGFPAVITGEDPFLQALQGMTCSSVPAFNEVADNLVRNQPVGPGGVDVPSSTLFRHEHLGVQSFHEIRKSVTGQNVYGTKGCPIQFETDHSKEDPLPCFEAITGNVAKALKLKNGLAKIGQNPCVKAKVTNIPLWTGLVYEAKEAGSLLGRTQHKLLVEQFRHARDADPFFYKIELNSTELAMIESTTLADVLRTAYDPQNNSGAIQDDVLLV